MDTIKSFKGYGKVDEAEQQAFRKKTRKRITILIISSVVLLAVVIGAVAGTLIHNRKNSNSGENSVPASDRTPAASIKAVCSVTEYPNSCLSSLQSSNTTDPELLFKLLLAGASAEMEKLAGYPALLLASAGENLKLRSAIKVCDAVFGDAAERLGDSAAAMKVAGAGEGEKILTSAKIEDMKTWLSASITDLETCVDALDEINATAVAGDMRVKMQNSTEFASNSLAVVAKILSLLTDFKIPIHRKLLGFGSGSSEFPEWVSPGDRRLLQSETVTPDVTVAADGTGDVKTIAEAVAKVGKKSVTRFVIYVKEGTYKENLVLDKSKWNVMMYGDSKTKTIVSGSLNFIDGTPTFSTATVAVAGRGFFARDMRFENTAGAAKHQAVAFRSGSDESVFYRCTFDGFQDTLYAHSNRQFYRDCDITGTIDFIFGNAAVVFQNCLIQPRQPMSNQFNTITAQGKKDPNQNTGISIQKCTFAPFDALTAPTYLGRPWKDFSTTVIMQSTIGSFLNPLGWKEWISNVDPPKTIFYAEYLNTGPGAGVGSRVKWAGYRSSLSAADAGKFTVGSFIQGSDWLPATSVTFDSTL